MKRHMVANAYLQIHETIEVNRAYKGPTLNPDLILLDAAPLSRALDGAVKSGYAERRQTAHEQSVDLFTLRILEQTKEGSDVEDVCRAFTQAAKRYGTLADERAVAGACAKASYFVHGARNL